MLIEASKLIGYPVLSLHTEGPVANAEREVVEPESLKIVAFEVWGAAIKNDPEAGEVLDTRDVREFAPIGMIVNSVDDFVNPGDVKKIDDAMALNFSLFGLKVETKKGTRLGKISDFMVDTNDFSVRQLIVKRPTLKGLIDPELVIPRKEIVEIDDYKVVVKDEEEKIRTKAVKEDFIPNFVNQFREPDFSASRRERDRE